MIELKKITKTFNQKGNVTHALCDVTLSVPKGKIVGVIGESGAGKSTLIRCVNLLERPTSGEVYVNGENLMRLSQKQLALARKNIGMIFQHFNLLSSRTAGENISLPLELNHIDKKDREKRVDELLDWVGLKDKKNEYPANLSGGQKQRIAIARTLANNPKVLLSDEATSALDPATTQSILSLLKNINTELNITILLITHEMDVVKNICDNIAVMNSGKLIEKGNVAEIFSHPKSELTQRFIDSTFRIDIPIDYQNRLKPLRESGKHPLVKLHITGNTVDEPILSEIVRKFHINNNIISAQMDYVGGVKFGIMLAEFIGSPENENQAIEYLMNKNMNVIVLGYV